MKIASERSSGIHVSYKTHSTHGHSVSANNHASSNCNCVRSGDGEQRMEFAVKVIL